MTPPTLRILVVDDSALYRQMVHNCLRRIPGVEVVGTAGDGAEALDAVERLRPDLVTLDVQMPTMDGIGFLREVRRRAIPLGVVMVSGLTAQGARATTDALLEGAFDSILKPVMSDLGAGREALATELSAKIAAYRAARDHARAGEAPVPKARLPAAPGERAATVVVIGASTGGPAALREVIPRLPATLAAPVVLVQHIAAAFTGALVARLDELSALHVVEAVDGMPLVAGTVAVAPGGRHLALGRGADGVRCTLVDAPPRHGCRPSVDVTLESAVGVFGGGVTAVILTGMGRDGTDGCLLVRRSGGRVLAQSPCGCAVYGMPKAVAEAGCADAILPLERMADAIVAATRTR